jgi:hypothetical protein
MKMNRRSFFSALSAAVIGVSLAAAIPAKANNTQKEVDIQKLFDNGFEPVMGYTLNQHLELIEKIKKNNILEKTWNETQIDNVSRYFVSIPDSACMKMWHVFGNTIIRNTINVHQYWNKAENISVSRHLGDIIGNPDRYAIVKRDLNLPGLSGFKY